MKYQTQKLAYPYFVAALALFLIQVLAGVLAGTIYVFPNFLSEAVPFHIIRMIHTNALLVWLLLGYFGASYFLIPEESECEIHSPKLASLQLGIFVFAALAAVVGYLFGIHEGRELLEQPFWIKILMVIAFLLFIYNVTMTVLKGRKTVVSIVLLLGLWGAALFFLFAFYNPDNLALDKLYWWWVVHVWVEGVWELIMAAMLAFLLIKLTGVDREVIEKWLYVIVGFSLFSGLLGTGHHYYWIGTPEYWHWIGAVFSILEVVPFFAMILWAFYLVYQSGRNHPNKAATLWSLGCPVMAFFGAGVLGLMHSFPSINFYTHGTQLTAAHGHLAFYGAYVMLNLAFFTYALPALRGLQPFNQILNMWSFWFMTGAMVFMTLTLAFAGILQTHLQRVLAMGFMQIQSQIELFYWFRLGAGLCFLIGAVLFIYSALGPVREQVTISRYSQSRSQ
ncbi:cbb3-type cytochrome c oxidase subunit I [Nitrosomonas sp. Nm58]|uniref:cbb3-type cytochrome c oxidase subunit I n=1 Tax=Nitrosomonas sp. Nm58 TaxID=200126 RepID=UPI000894560C|nr:cbb3-type cytochrome c oxidase subunit I [Nitrosomonas sp. Nm58]SDX99970.1 nitric oxide reductase subunit B [Nitrosomonas sp. Nm58]